MSASFSIAGFSVPPLVFAAACGAATCWYILKFWLALQSTFWPTRTARILDARIDETRDSDGDATYVPAVRYEFRILGDVYESTCLSFSDMSSPRYDDAIDALSGVDAGRLHPVRVHPRIPQLSVVRPGARLRDYVVIVVLATMTVVALGFSRS